MRKIIIAILICSLTLSMGILSGCGESSDEVHYADQDFIKSVSKGLEKRWAMNDKDADKDTTLEMMEGYIQAELDELTQYETATFEDTKLQEKALNYINCLKDSKENVEWFLSDEDYDKWDNIWKQRAVLIKDFVDNYGLTVSDKYQATLDEFLAEGKAVENQSKQEDEINQLIEGLEFDVAKNDYGWKTYRATLENTTDYDIKEISIDVNLLDSEGTIVSTEYAYVENVAKGQKANVEFETDTSFDKIELKVDYFEVDE